MRNATNFVGFSTRYSRLQIFRALRIPQGQRTDLVNETSAHDEPKLFDPSHEKRIRAANRAAEAIPVIGELLDRQLIAIDVAAQLGRDIKDPKNLTAEEREYASFYLSLVFFWSWHSV